MQLEVEYIGLINNGNYEKVKSTLYDQHFGKPKNFIEIKSLVSNLKTTTTFSNWENDPVVDLQVFFSNLEVLYSVHTFIANELQDDDFKKYVKYLLKTGTVWCEVDYYYVADCYNPTKPHYVILLVCLLVLCGNKFTDCVRCLKFSVILNEIKNNSSPIFNELMLLIEITCVRSLDEGMVRVMIKENKQWLSKYFVTTLALKCILDNEKKFFHFLCSECSGLGKLESATKFITKNTDTTIFY